MDNLKQNAILVRDALIEAQIELHRKYDKIRSVLPAAQALVDGVGDGWLQVPKDDEDANARGLEWPPRNVPVLMCWRHWSTGNFEYEAGLHSGDRWSHGSAEYWQHLPTPPAMKGNDLC
jgi:hypothetical protein